MQELHLILFVIFSKEHGFVTEDKREESERTQTRSIANTHIIFWSKIQLNQYHWSVVVSLLNKGTAIYKYKRTSKKKSLQKKHYRT